MMMKSYSSTIIALATVVLVDASTRNTALSSSLRALAPASTTAAAAAADSNQRIVGGNESDEGEFPYYVGMGGW